MCVCVVCGEGGVSVINGISFVPTKKNRLLMIAQNLCELLFDTWLNLDMSFSVKLVFGTY